MKLKYSLLACIIVLMFSCSCGRIPASQPGKTRTLKAVKKLKVVTTILPLYDIAVNVGGSRAEVHNLLPPGASPHTFEPTPDDLKLLEESDLVIMLGLGLDDWMDKMIASSGKEKKVIIASEGVETIKMESGEESESHVDADKDGHHHEEGLDPHVWMDPLRMIVMAENVKSAFIKEMPKKKDYFEKNFKAYSESLKKLDGDFTRELSRFKKKDFITFHSFMNYLAGRYGLTPAGVIVDSPGKEPDSARVMNIVKVLKEKNVKVVFVEPQFSPKASMVIAQEIGGEVLTVDPLGSLDDSARDTYEKNMRENLKVLIQAFSHEEK